MIEVYDIESYPNVFTFVFREVTKERKITTYEMSSRINQIPELILHLKRKGLTLVGYNNIYFDYPIIHYILTHPNCTVEELYYYVQCKIIPSQFPLIPVWKILIPQVDLYKINHYDNKNRRTSLKWLEFTLRWSKLQDLPFKVGSIIPLDKLDFLIEYNINDVDFTYEFLGKCLDAIVFRQEMSAFLKKDVMNYSDVKIGEYINQVNYQKLTGIEFKHFKNLRTNRSSVNIDDLIPSFIKFKTKPLQDFLESIRGVTLDLMSEDTFERNIIIGNLHVNFKKGGLHSEDTAKVFACKDGYYLKEKDVGSMYPKAIIAGKMYPWHLGVEWNEGIKLLYDERVNELKPQLKKLKRGSKEYKFIDSKQEAYKLAMNGGGYGKTGSKYSWQYDYKVMLEVTFRGQLSLLMLLEEYHLMGLELISANTDGVVIHYPKELDGKVQEVHDAWEIMTDSILEDTFYKQIIFRDVNNYIAEIINGDTQERIKFKFKGCFEIDQDFHKNNSQRIVPIAVKEYFMNNVPVADTIKNLGVTFINSKDKEEKTTIYDYCKGVKRGAATESYCFVGKETTYITDKVIRYYVSTTDSKMFKVYNDGRVHRITKGFNVIPFMNYEEKEDYNINYDYYINECNKIIKPIELGTRKIGYIEPEQLNLF